MNFNSLISHEPLIRGVLFALVLLAMVFWEIVARRRPQRVRRLNRWPGNLSIVFLDTLVVRLIFPVTAVGIALVVSEQDWGLFNVVNLPIWLSLVASVIVLDLVIYLQHRLFHAVPWLWRLHRMHHADLELDVTTGLRFHPLEILASMAIKLGVVVLIGVPALGVLIFEILLNATSMFNHANVRLPGRSDRWLRMVLVTPDMHRVHHSINCRETNSNFGFNLACWDRLFNTYKAQPSDGHLEMKLGLKEFREPRDLSLYQMLIQPFVNRN